MDGDEVEQNRRQHLGGVAPEPQRRGDRSPERAGDERRCQRRDDPIARAEKRAERAGQELSLAADVPDSGAKGDGHGEAGEQQRDGLEQRPFQRERRTDRATDQNRQQLAVAECQAAEREQGHGGEGGEDGDDEASESGGGGGEWGSREQPAHAPAPASRLSTPAINCGARTAASSGVSRGLSAPR